MVFRFVPRMEPLELREVPAVIWKWEPIENSVDGGIAENWLRNGVQQLTEIPDGNDDNLIYVGGDQNNKPCNLRITQNVLGTITVDDGYTSQIKLGANTAFVGCSILGACTIDLNGKTCNFGNVGANPGVIGSQANGGTRVTISGDGSIEVGNQEKLDLSNVTLGSSVNVNAGGKLYFGYITYGNSTDDTFRIWGGGTAETNSQNSTFISNQNRGTYYQPIFVMPNGNLKFVTSTTVVSYISCSGTTLVQGTQANPNVTLTITGKDLLNTALIVNQPGILNLAAGSTISGTVEVNGGMNLFGPPPGSTAGTATIAQGNLKVIGTATTSAVLNLNTSTLYVSNGNVTFSYAAVTTHVVYGPGLAPGGAQMGNITVNGSVTFNNTNTLTQGATGTPTNFDLPLITCTSRTGDFTVYVLSDGVVAEAVGNNLRLKRQV